ncbi:MAG: aspartate--ammonia ligase, partial [Clostridiales bacterium]
MSTKYPGNYKPVLSLEQTEKAIKLVKDTFELHLSTELHLRRVTAPLFVLRGTGVNDDLNGIEKPVSFQIKDMNGATAEIVQSLAKWKRMMLADYKISVNNGIYTDMNAVRPDEMLDNLHSLYVDQWDWERVMTPDQRNVAFLKKMVRSIYNVFRQTEYAVYENYPEIKPILPEEITFVHSEEMLKAYPNLTPFERECKYAEKHGAIFVIGIGN